MARDHGRIGHVAVMFVADSFPDEVREEKQETPDPSSASMVGPAQALGHRAQLNVLVGLSYSCATPQGA